MSGLVFERLLTLYSVINYLAGPRYLLFFALPRRECAVPVQVVNACVVKPLSKGHLGTRTVCP